MPVHLNACFSPYGCNLHWEDKWKIHILKKADSSWDALHITLFTKSFFCGCIFRPLNSELYIEFIGFQVVV